MAHRISLLWGVTLATIASASMAQMVAQPALAPAPVTARTSNSAPAAAPAPVAPAVAPAANLGTASGANAPALPVQVVAAAPASLKFGALWNGDAALRKDFTIKSVPRAGQVIVSIAGKSPFKVVGVRVWGAPPKGPKLASAQPSTQLSGGAGSSVQLAQQASQPSLNLPAGMVLKAAVLSAPFKVQADVKDRIIVSVEFAPKWSLSEVAGPKAAKVNVTGFQWKSEIEAKGDFNGLKLGMAVVVEPSTLYAPKPIYAPGQRFPLWPSTAVLSVVNSTGSPQSVMLELEPNAQGVQLNPVAAGFSAGQAHKLPLSLTWDPRQEPTGDFKVRLLFGGKTTLAAFHVEFLPSWRSFNASGPGWQVTATVTSGGEQRFDTQCFPAEGRTAHDCSFWIYRNGQYVASSAGQTNTLGGKSMDQRVWVPEKGLDPEEVFKRMQAAWSVVEIDGTGGNPSQYPQVPMNLLP